MDAWRPSPPLRLPQSNASLRVAIPKTLHPKARHARRPRNRSKILCRRQDPARASPTGSASSPSTIPNKRNAMSLEMWEGVGQALDRIARRRRCARRDPDRRRRQGVHVGRRYQPVREKPPQRAGFGRIFEEERRAARAAGGLPEADHRLHPRLLPRRRHAGRDVGGHPLCVRQQPVRHSRRQTRHRLWL